MMMQRLAPHEAVERMDNAPETLNFLLSDFIEQFGFKEQELLDELRSGRLVAQGTPTDDGYEDIGVTVASLTDWIFNRESPWDLVRKVCFVAFEPAGNA